MFTPGYRSLYIIIIQCLIVIMLYFIYTVYTYHFPMRNPYIQFLCPCWVISYPSALDMKHNGYIQIYCHHCRYSHHHIDISYYILPSCFPWLWLYCYIWIYHIIAGLPSNTKILYFISNISVIVIVLPIIFLSSLSLYSDNYYDIPIIIAFLILLLFYHYSANYIPMISSFVITMIFLLLP